MKKAILISLLAISPGSAFANDCDVKANIVTCLNSASDHVDLFQMSQIQDVSFTAVTPLGSHTAFPQDVRFDGSYAVKIDGININLCDPASRQYFLAFYTASRQLLKTSHLFLNEGDNFVSCDTPPPVAVPPAAGNLGACHPQEKWVSDCRIYNPGVSVGTCIDWCLAESTPPTFTTPVTFLPPSLGVCHPHGKWVSDCRIYNPGVSEFQCQQWCAAEH